ncbi:VapE domain-containing protein [Aeromonas sp. FDAARGOS 1416]|uniref:VapE domain-containing protein n=1 Tax=Aeromonas TaxID=642 RepID=UPI001C24CF05|nr:VapE domain-containing protein [Aeromonas sp. FDAARGOS 1416]QXB03463.1 virulence-associated E family protein [Aeromonas sp. FDAARGOS 1416]
MQPKYNDLSDPSQGDWLDKQLHELNIYDLIPVYKLPQLPSDPLRHTPAKYANGEKYPIQHTEWSRACRDWVGIRLNRFVLVDWDGYKPESISFDTLAEALGFTGDELMTHCIQWNAESTSLHFLFVMPNWVNVEEFKQANNGKWFAGVDIKTGNQLAYVKASKTNRMAGFVPREAPSPVLAALKKEGKTSAHINTKVMLDSEAIHTINECDPDTGYDKWLKVITGTVDQYGKGEDVINTLDRWSSKSKKYKGRHEIESKVKSITQGGGTTWGTVLHMAGKTRAQITPISAHEAFKGYQLPPDSPKLVGMMREYPYPDRTFDKANKPLQTSDNLKTLLKNMGIQIATNKMNLNLDIEQDGRIVEPSFEALRSMLIDEAQKTGLPIQTIDYHLAAIGEQNSYHPIAAALDGKHWDGVERVQRVLDCLPCTDPPHKDTVFKKWFIAAMAAIYEPSFSAKLVPVLKGGQSTRKSAFLSRVCSIVEGSFLPEASLDAENKDSVIAVASHHIVELSELERTTRKEAGALKAHITKDIDTFRAPYARSAINKRRQGVFVGTVNDDEFFKDTTGNSRFAVIELTGKISLDAVNDILGYSYDNGRVRQTDREQLLQFWLEVKHWYDTGWSWVLTDSESEHSEANNSRFMVKGDYYHLIMEKMELWWNGHNVGISASEAAGRLGLNASYSGKVGKDLAQLAKDGLLRVGEGRQRRQYFKA